MKHKHENITLSFPHDLNALLHLRVQRRGISKYVADAVKKALDTDERKKQLNLEAAYEASNHDKDRLEVIEDWKALDGLDDVPGWEWKDE